MKKSKVSTLLARYGAMAETREAKKKMTTKTPKRMLRMARKMKSKATIRTRKRRKRKYVM